MQILKMLVVLLYYQKTNQLSKDAFVWDPKIPWLLDKSSYSDDNTDSVQDHYDQKIGKSTEVNFDKDIKKVEEVFEEIRNLVWADIDDLFGLQAKLFIPEVTKSLFLKNQT